MARRRVMIVPISEAVPGDRPPALVPRLWRRLTAAQRRDLAQLIARLLRSRLADGQRPSEAGHAEHAGGSGRPGDDGAPAKLAYIYVRQSTAGQVRQHQESTELQYRLVDRAICFGWPKERVEVIDDDLGKSGTSSKGRGGFQRLIAEIGLGKAGLVLSLDASRLVRNNHD